MNGAGTVHQFHLSAVALETGIEKMFVLLSTAYFRYELTFFVYHKFMFFVVREHLGRFQFAPKIGFYFDRFIISYSFFKRNHKRKYTIEKTKFIASHWNTFFFSILLGYLCGQITDASTKYHYQTINKHEQKIFDRNEKRNKFEKIFCLIFYWFLYMPRLDYQ